MNTGVKNIKDQWITEAGQKFSFECRFAIPITLEHSSANNGLEYITFIIEVSGFSLTKSTQSQSNYIMSAPLPLIQQTARNRILMTFDETSIL